MTNWLRIIALLLSPVLFAVVGWIDFHVIFTAGHLEPREFEGIVKFIAITLKTPPIVLVATGFLLPVLVPVFSLSLIRRLIINGSRWRKPYYAVFLMNCFVAVYFMTFGGVPMLVFNDDVFFQIIYSLSVFAMLVVPLMYLLWYQNWDTPRKT